MSNLVRFLFLTIFLITDVSARCGDFTKVAELLDTQNFLRSSREGRLRGVGEMSVNLADVSQAKSLAFKFPAFEALGFGTPGAGWAPYQARLERSSLHGKRVGWERSSPQGHARVRLDWDPVKGAHYNIEITHRTPGRTETHKLAVMFKCDNHPCSEREVVALADRMQ